MSDVKVKFAYFDINGGKVTAAYRILGEKNSINRTVEFACSYCSPKDRFEKPKGRMIATNRLNCERTVNRIDVELDYSNVDKSIYHQVIQRIEPFIDVALNRQIKWLNLI